MDSLTCAYLALELDARWRDRRVDGCRFDRTARSVAVCVTGSLPVQFDLSRMSARVAEAAGEPPGELLVGWIVSTVHAPVDERRLLIRFQRAGKFRGSVARSAMLEISMIPAARGATLTGEGGHRMGAIGSAPPDAREPRRVLSAEEVTSAAARGDPASLLEGRWMSPALARWLVSEPQQAADRYAHIAELGAPSPHRCGEEIVPFAWCDGAEPVRSLIAPAGVAVDEPSAPDRASARERAVERMRAQLARAVDAPRIRAIADALSALGDAPAPAALTLNDGARVEVDSKPGETAIMVAERMYREVRSLERAAERLPARIAEMQQPSRTPVRKRPSRERAIGDEAPARPFREYRSSGGLAIWVGRGAASNDRLTFRESSPDDVWLHARDSAGAHVVLRWTKPENPPARDLEEAALLAAWHSRNRGSTVVPVDWTRRKHVRKARGASPGQVLVQRASTVFVRPSAEAERRLREPLA